MDQLLEVTNIKTELTDSTCSHQVEISTDGKSNSIKQESDCLVQSKIFIKTEHQEDKSEFPVNASASYYMCPSYDIKFETEEPVVKIEHNILLNELMQDPLGVHSQIKDEHFPIVLDQSESRIKTELTGGEKDENFLESDEDSDSHRGESNCQDKQLLRNNLDCRVKKYVCNECNKIFGRKSHLDNHLRIHTGEKPFSCDICKKSFNRKNNWDIHMLIHSGEKPHVCNVCKKAFRYKSNINKHKLIHEGVKPFSCFMCKKSFRQKEGLVKHKRMHVGEKPFTCDVCKKSFTVKSHLTVHRRTHTGEKPYSCDICNKSFVDKSHLNRHKKIHKN